MPEGVDRFLPRCADRFQMFFADRAELQRRTDDPDRQIEGQTDDPDGNTLGK